MPKCWLCDEEKSLRDSHSVPNSYFKAIFRKNNGWGLLLTQNQVIPNHSDSGDWQLLCGDCESKINHQCETYSINKLKLRNNSNDYTHSIVFDDIDCSRILRFCIAILWRASISPAEYFRDFRLDRDIEVTFKKYLAGHLDKIDERLFSFTIEKAYTPGQNESSFDESFLLPPINCSDKNRRTYQFIVVGFLFSLITPRLSLRERSGIKLIKASDTRLVARRTSIFEHKHIMPFLAKHVHEERERRGL